MGLFSLHLDNGQWRLQGAKVFLRWGLVDRNVQIVVLGLDVDGVGEQSALTHQKVQQDLPNHFLRLAGQKQFDASAQALRVLQIVSLVNPQLAVDFGAEWFHGTSSPKYLSTSDTKFSQWNVDLASRNAFKL